MKVLILGGYGVFGGRLAELLCRDGHGVTVAGRDAAKAEALAARLNCDALGLDRDGDLSALRGFDAVVDAAGPFHAYGDDPYRFAKATLAAGAHYLDLSDEAAFCGGISAIDAEARAAGRAAISGLSSVPAISSAAVTELAGDDGAEAIDTAILPGNRSPRGTSVMTSILSRSGRPFALWRGGRWTTARGWSEPRDYALPGGLVRQGWLIEVPDTALFPAHFGASSVVFRAGLELGVMRYGLAAFAALRRLVPFPVGPGLVRVFRWAADALSPFGSGRGGMSVSVIAGGERRVWRLQAEDGDGPFVPAVAARALLRRGTLTPGARPALGVVTLDEIEAAMSGLSVTTERHVEPWGSVFQRVLGPAFAGLPPEVAATHLTSDVTVLRGRASVARGQGPWSRLIGALFRFPAATDDIAVEVIKSVTPKGETWERRFGTRRFRSHLSATPEGLSETFAPFTFDIGLRVEDGSLHFPVRSGRIGRLRLPRWMLPVSDAREYVEDGRFRFDVRLLAPVTGGLIAHYRGWLLPAAEDGGV